MAGKVYFERRCIRLALKTYLENANWTGLTFQEGFMSENTIDTPLVTIDIVRPRKKALEMNDQSKTFERNVQIDVYMESEPRVILINDDIADFIDLTPMNILDGETNVLGSLICYDTDSINSEVFPPILVDPKLRRWRGIIRATYEAHYL